MAKGFTSGGVDFDDLFDPDVQGDGPAASWLTSGGVPLKYAAIGYGTKRVDVGFRDSGGVDVSNLWAAKGSASYFPGSLEASTVSQTAAPCAASIRIAIKTNGSIVVAANGTTKSVGGSTTVFGTSSAPYDFRIEGNVTGIRNSGSGATTLTGKGGVSYAASSINGTTASFDTGWQASADDSANFLDIVTNAPGNSGLSELRGRLSIQIRNKSTGQVRTMPANFWAMSDSQG